MTVPEPISIASVVRFGQPWWLLAAAAAALPVLLSLRARRRGRHVPWVNVALQCLAVLAAAAALARPDAPIGREGRTVTLVLQDVSASCRGQIEPRVKLPEGVAARRWDFAADISTAGPAGGSVDANQTLLAPALGLALARRDEFSGLVLRTDGRFTDDGWRAPSALAGWVSVPVAIMPMESPPADARVEELSAERDAAGRVDIRLTLRANALARRTVTVRRTRPPLADPLLTRRMDLLRGRPATIRLTDTPPGPELAVYRAELSADDRFPENDSAEALVLPLRRRLAVVGDGIDPGALATAAGLPAERVPPDAASGSPVAWSEYSAVVLIDPNGALLSAGRRAALAEYVRTGGGLVLVGAGPYASPADRTDPLNRVAALIANPYERKPLDLTVVLDASGSMAEPVDAAGPTDGRIKFHQAVGAVLSLRRHLTEADALRVITFSDSPRRVYESGPEEIDFAKLAEALGRVRPAGPTDAGKALELAAAEAPVEGKDGLVLLVSDLLTKPFRADQAAAAFRKQKLSLAIIAIGPGGAGPAGAAPPGPAPLETLSRLLGGPPIIRRDRLAGLAKVFAGLLRDTRGDALRRGQFKAAAVRAPFGRPAGPLPDVTAYLLCAPQPKAEVYARVGGDNDALLATRQVGLGRSVSLALGGGPGENAAWARAGELVGLVSAAVKWALRPAGDPRFAGHLRRDGQDLSIRLDAADANGPMNLLELTARVRPADPPDAEAEDVPLRQVAPGRYEASVRVGPAAAGVTAQLADGPVVWAAAAARTAPREFAAVGVDWDNLRLLARLTGGRITNARDLGSFRRALYERTRTALWPVLLAAAAALMLVDWAVARIWRRGG